MRLGLQFLMDHGDAALQSLHRTLKADFFAVQEYLSRVRLVDAEQALHQRGLAGAVFAHQRVHLARLDFEMDVVERAHAGKVLGDAVHLQYISLLIHPGCLLNWTEGECPLALSLLSRVYQPMVSRLSMVTGT